MKNYQEKLKKLGEVAIFVGYPEDHHFDTYRLFMKNNRNIVQFRDVVWIDKPFNKYFKTKHVRNDDAVEEEESEDQVELSL
jgi:hypothetical protein